MKSTEDFVIVNSFGKSEPDQNRTELMDSIEFEDEEYSLQLIKDNEQNLEAEDINGLQAIDYAIIRNKPRVLQALIERNVNVNKTAGDKNKTRPLTLAIIPINNNILNILLTANPSVNFTLSSTGLTPLMAIAGLANQEALQTVIRLGAYINAEDQNGDNALTHAVRLCNTDAIVTLRNHGASITPNQKRSATRFLNPREILLVEEALKSPDLRSWSEFIRDQAKAPFQMMGII